VVDVVSKVSIAVTGKSAIDGDDSMAIDDGTSSPHVVVSQESNITNAQQTLRELEGTDLNVTVTTNIEHFSGVYNVNSILAVTGGIIITLDGKTKTPILIIGNYHLLLVYKPYRSSSYRHAVYTPKVRADY
jgi:hypothetical protein